jgi:MscS family membrane protein
MVVPMTATTRGQWIQLVSDRLPWQVLALCLGLWLVTSAAAQEEPSQEEKKVEAAEVLAEILAAEEPEVFKDTLDRETPRSSASAFLLAAEQGDFERASRYLDFRNLPQELRGASRTELAEQFYLVISRVLWLDIEGISDDVRGDLEDDLPPYRDKVGEVALGDENLTLMMQRVPADEPGQFIWKISNATVAEIPGLHDQYGYPEWVEAFRGKFPSRASMLGVELFKWALLLIMMAISWPILWLFFAGLTRLLSAPSSGLYPEVKKLLTRPLPILILVLLGTWLLRELGMGATAQKILQAHTVGTFIVVWFLFSLIDLVRAVRRERFIAQGRDDAAVLGRPMANALKLMVALLAVLVWLSNMGVNISALLAGLGVGGIAMALALQKPIEDLFGAITLYSQRPVSTGDVCRYGAHFGRVEEIGLRSTRIRTQGNTVVSVPNSRLAYEDIENISARRNVWYQPLIRMRIDTTPDQMREIVERVRQMLVEDERVLNDVLRVQFRKFGEYSLDIKVHCYVDTVDFNEYLTIAEQLNFRILEIVHDVGASLALPERGASFSQSA